MTPDRLQEIRQRLVKFADELQPYQDTYQAEAELLHEAADLLAALATAEAEGRRQGIEQVLVVWDQWRCQLNPGFGITHPDGQRFVNAVRQLLPQTTHP